MRPDTLPDEALRTPVARSIGAALLTVTIVALLGICLLNSPPRFSEKHLQDTSLLRPVVDALAMGGRFPTSRGVEIRNLVFYTGSAMLAVLAGLYLLSGSVHTRLSLDDLLEVRDRAGSPFFWWIILVAASFIGSMFSHAPEFCQGQTIIRVLQLAWWWPIAALLPMAHARSLATALCVILGLTALVGLWYHIVRVMPDVSGARLRYPIGNELWMAACLLPGAFICGGLVLHHLLSVRNDASGNIPRARWPWIAVLIVAGICIVTALALTRSRSAAAGLVAGLFIIAVIWTPRRKRLASILVMLVISSLAVVTLQTLRVTGSTGQRAHSIRARLDYEWPYAIRLFFEKPVGGNGDGAYALLAGQFAREDQLDDPNIMRLDESSWPSHAHNEFLELLSDIGLVGMGAFLFALFIPLYRAVQLCDRRRDEAKARGERMLVMGLAAALVAMVVEACGTPSIREPGAAPIFLTVWALLWVMVRDEAPKRPPIPDERPLARATVRFFGIAVCFVAMLLGHRGIQDWQAARAYFEAGRTMDDVQYVAAMGEADFAAAHTLDPFRRALAAMMSVHARSLHFDSVLASGQDAPTTQDLEVTSEALSRMNRLKHAAPRFLRLSRIEAELELNRARAYQRRGEPANEAHCQERFLAALRQSRSDEPFLIERVEQLWAIDGSATATDRILWLRCLMRGGEVEARFVQLVQVLLAMPGVGEALEIVYRAATQDEHEPADAWRDRLAPESWRLLAMIQGITGQHGHAIELTAKAQRMYEAAGPRLFAGHSAAIHEEVRYRYSSDPLGQTELCLDRLAAAFSVAYGPADRDTILHDVTLGRTRAIVLLSADRESDARAQLAAIYPPGVLGATETTPEADAHDLLLAGLYLELSNSLLIDGRFVDRAIACSHRALALVPDMPDAWFMLSRAYLATSHDDAALEAIEKLLVITPNRDAAMEALRRLRLQHPDREVWKEMERRHPEIGNSASTAPETR